MLSLNTLTDIASQIWGDKTPPIPILKISTPFDEALKDYAFEAAIYPHAYEKQWKNTGDFMTRETADSSHAYRFREAAHFVAMTYILSAHDMAGIEQKRCATHRGVTIQEHLMEYGQCIIDAEIQVRNHTQKHHLFMRGMDERDSAAMAGFYALTHYVLQQITPHVIPAFQESCRSAVLDCDKQMRRFGFERLHTPEELRRITMLAEMRVTAESLREKGLHPLIPTGRPMEREPMLHQPSAPCETTDFQRRLAKQAARKARIAGIA